MKARLIAYTQPTEEFAEEFSSDIKDFIAYCARVSNPANQYNPDNEKLLSYLREHAHWSPFEMANATLEIETTRDIARQILRHRSFSFQEFSQRYANVDAMGEDTFVYREARRQDAKNRQNSVDLDLNSVYDRDINSEWYARQRAVAAAAKETYDWAISQGLAKEVARAVLPEGLTASRMYMQGSIRSWIHFLDLRTGNGTQKECREVALACAAAIAKVFGV